MKDFFGGLVVLVIAAVMIGGAIGAIGVGWNGLYEVRLDTTEPTTIGSLAWIVNRYTGDVKLCRLDFQAPPEPSTDVYPVPFCGFERDANVVLFHKRLGVR